MANTSILRKTPTNAGIFNRRIRIVRERKIKDADGFPVVERETVGVYHASVKTTRGYTLIKNDTDFEKAYTNFTIRYPARTQITRDDLIEFGGKTYEIQYLNNVNEAGVTLEIQAKEVTH